MQAGMAFDAGTWWLVGILLTALLGVVGALISRSIFKRLDDNSADIKEVRENYTTRAQHGEDLREIRAELSAAQKDNHTEYKALREELRDLRENTLRKDDFLRSMMQMEKKMDEIYKFLLERGAE